MKTTKVKISGDVAMIMLGALLLLTAYLFSEKLETHYFGNATVELPDSLEMKNVEATFFLTDEKTGPRITFWEVPPTTADNAVAEFEQLLKDNETIKKATSLNKAEYWKVDFSEILDRPALISIREVRPNSFGLTIEGEFNDALPAGDRLEIYLALPTPAATLYFTYLESIDWPAKKPNMTYVADKQKVLVDWALGFLAHYQWLGENAPQSGQQLATRYGRIDLSGDPAYQRYNLTAEFSKSSGTNNHLHISLNSLPTWEQKRAGARASKGLEDKPLANSPKSHVLNGGWYLEEKHVKGNPHVPSIHFTWTNATYGFYGPEHPSFTIAYYIASKEPNTPELPEVQNTWTTVLETLKISPIED